MKPKWIVLCTLFLALSCPKTDTSHYKIIDEQKLISDLYQALFLYHIDNQKFPNEKAGLVYGLLRTGKNSPYYFFSNEGLFAANKIVRSDGKTTVKKQNYVKPGDKILLYNGEVLTYEVNNSKGKFKILGFSDRDILNKHPYLNKVLQFKNLPKLTYKKFPHAKNGASYLEGIPLKFYLK